MQKIKKISTISTVILMIAMFASLITLPAIEAQSISYNTTYLYVGTNAKLVGLGQNVLLIFWTKDIPPDIGETAGTVASPTTRAGWDGVKLIVTKPNGVNETINMPR